MGAHGLRRTFAKLGTAIGETPEALIIVHAGGSAATAQARVTDKAGTIYATGTTTCLILTER